MRGEEEEEEIWFDSVGVVALPLLPLPYPSRTWPHAPRVRPRSPPRGTRRRPPRTAPARAGTAPHAHAPPPACWRRRSAGTARATPRCSAPR
jgi:hypothetical protein